MKSALLLAVLVLAVILPIAARASTKPDVVAATRQFLDAYAAGDEATVLSLSANDIAIYGSDIAEVVRGKDALRTFLADDHRLWGSGVEIGAMQDVSVMRGGPLASVFFNAPFRLAGRPPVMVRFATVWRLDGERWILAQSANSVPTRGQSAAELLRAVR